MEGGRLLRSGWEVDGDVGEGSWGWAGGGKEVTEVGELGGKKRLLLRWSASGLWWLLSSVGTCERVADLSQLYPKILLSPSFS